MFRFHFLFYMSPCSASVLLTRYIFKSHLLLFLRGLERIGKCINWNLQCAQNFFGKRNVSIKCNVHVHVASKGGVSIEPRALERLPKQSHLITTSSSTIHPLAPLTSSLQ